MTTLIDWAPRQFAIEYDNSKAFQLRDRKVVKEYSDRDADWKPWPGPQKNVYSWCILDNGYAVGWNESQTRGWSFPVVKLK